MRESTCSVVVLSARRPVMVRINTISFTSPPAIRTGMIGPMQPVT